jgi:hypothetical protein
MAYLLDRLLIFGNSSGSGSSAFLTGGAGAAKGGTPGRGDLQQPQKPVMLKEICDISVVGRVIYSDGTML